MNSFSNDKLPSFVKSIDFGEIRDESLFIKNVFLAGNLRVGVHL